MARRAHLFLALAAILVVGAAAGGSSNSGAKESPADKASRSKLAVAPVCQAVKEAGKNYDTCATFRAELCDSVKSDSCDLCSFLTNDEGCDLQTGEEVADAIAAASADTLAQANAYTDKKFAEGKAYTDAQVAIAKAEAKSYTDAQVAIAKAESKKYTDDAIAAVFAKYSSAGARYDSSCNLIFEIVPPGAQPSTCTVVGGDFIVTTYCPSGTIPVNIGCIDPYAPSDVIPGSSPTGNWIFDPTQAQCAVATNTPNGEVSLVYSCIPNVPPAATAAVMAKSRAAGSKLVAPARAGARVAKKP